VKNLFVTSLVVLVAVFGISPLAVCEETIRVRVNYKSDPPGAILYIKEQGVSERRIGYTPYSMDYSLSLEDGMKDDVKQSFTLPAYVRWQSGATAKTTILINMTPIELRKIDGTEKTFTFNRPKNVPGRGADEQFALKVEAEIRQALFQEKQLKLQALQIQRQGLQPAPTITIQSPSPPEPSSPHINCRSYEAGGSVFTDCN
jgi:hypothetical protein